MKNKFIENVLKKLQSYAFIIFIALLIGAFFIVAQINRSNKDNDKKDIPAGQDEDPDVEDPTVDNSNEKFVLPVSHAEVTIARNYYDLSLDEDERIKAIVYYGNGRYEENNGINYTLDNETTFDVVASLSGEVISVRNDELLGTFVEVEHLYGYVTRYYSLASTTVEVGDIIEQGDEIGESGSNIDTESGIHVHFEIAKGTQTFNPADLIGKTLKELEGN